MVKLRHAEEVKQSFAIRANELRKSGPVSRLKSRLTGLSSKLILAANFTDFVDKSGVGVPD